MCLMNPLLYSLYTLDCTDTHSTNYVIKFAEDTVVVALISNDNETAYLDEVFS